jgi:hypothetical protein
MSLDVPVIDCNRTIALLLRVDSRAIFNRCATVDDAQMRRINPSRADRHVTVCGENGIRVCCRGSSGGRETDMNAAIHGIGSFTRAAKNNRLLRAIGRNDVFAELVNIPLAASARARGHDQREQDDWSQSAR